MLKALKRMVSKGYLYSGGFQNLLFSLTPIGEAVSKKPAAKRRKTIPAIAVEKQVVVEPEKTAVPLTPPPSALSPQKLIASPQAPYASPIISVDSPMGMSPMDTSPRDTFPIPREEWHMLIGDEDATLPAFKGPAFRGITLEEAIKLVPADDGGVWDEVLQLRQAKEDLSKPQSPDGKIRKLEDQVALMQKRLDKLDHELITAEDELITLRTLTDRWEEAQHGHLIADAAIRQYSEMRETLPRQKEALEKELRSLALNHRLELQLVRVEKDLRIEEIKKQTQMSLDEIEEEQKALHQHRGSDN